MAFSHRIKTHSLSFTFLLAVAVLTPQSSTAQNPAPQPAAQPNGTPQTQTPKEPEPPPKPGQLPASQQPGVLAPGKTPQGEDKRIFGVLPNYRTAERSAEYQPISVHRKLVIATKDSFDYPLVILSMAYAGLYQLDNNHPQFGQGVEGYAKRLGTSYADQTIGNFMTEGFMPILFHEDPRYFRLAEGPKRHRAIYALSRIFVTRTDSGKTSFNFAEVVGNGVGAGIGLSYYEDDRNVSGYMENWGTALATDATSQVLKEFWPDVKRWWYNKHHPGQAAAAPVTGPATSKP
jgi:hypothetical protein